MNIDNLPKKLIDGIMVAIFVELFLRFVKKEIWPQVKKIDKFFNRNFKYSHSIEPTTEYNALYCSNNAVTFSSKTFELENKQPVFISGKQYNIAWFIISATVSLIFGFILLPIIQILAAFASIFFISLSTIIFRPCILGNWLFLFQKGHLFKIKASKIFSNTVHINY